MCSNDKRVANIQSVQIIYKNTKLTGCQTLGMPTAQSVHCVYQLDRLGSRSSWHDNHTKHVASAMADAAVRSISTNLQSENEAAEKYDPPSAAAVFGAQKP